MSDHKLTIFISYVAEDETLALALKNLLEGIFLNADVFVSSRDLAGGDVWVEQLRSRLSEATIIIALVTRFSMTSLWVHFEAGAGFVRKCTIPLVADGVTIANLKEPLKLLQARVFDRNGLTSLVQDVAIAAGLRTPDRCPGIDDAIRKANEFISLRSQSRSSTTPVDSQPSHVIPKMRQNKTEKDLELSQKVEELKGRAQKIIQENVERHRGAFDLPSYDEIKQYSFYELSDLARAVGEDVPFRIVSLAWKYNDLPDADAPAWKKLNSRREIEEIENQLNKYEKSTRRLKGR